MSLACSPQLLFLSVCRTLKNFCAAYGLIRRRFHARRKHSVLNRKPTDIDYCERTGVIATPNGFVKPVIVFVGAPPAGYFQKTTDCCDGTEPASNDSLVTNCATSCERFTVPDSWMPSP